MDKRQVIIEREKSKPGLRGKINAKCIECLYDPDGCSGTWRQQVKECTSTDCPLFLVRPLPSDGNS